MIDQELLELKRQHQIMMDQMMMSQMNAGMGSLGYQALMNPEPRPQAQPLLEEQHIVEAVSGWRRWSVPMFGEQLLSNNGTEWVPYEKQAAKCKKGKDCQGIGCGCGIYAYKARADAKSGDNPPTQVTHIWGEVWLWGRVIEYTKGFRAQFAYPKAFVNTGGIAQRLATVYGVKVID